MGSPTLGRQIYLARKAAGLTREALSEMLSLSKTAVMKWEDGSNSPSVENLIKLEAALGVRFYLSGGTPHEHSGEGWRVPENVTPDMVDMTVMLSRDNGLDLHHATRHPAGFLRPQKNRSLD